MPRNEFKAREFYISELMEMTDLQLQDLLNQGLITRADIRRARRQDHPGKGESGSSDLESKPVEAASSDEGIVQPSPADYRRVPGDQTTKEHIAERYGAEDTPLS